MSKIRFAAIAAITLLWSFPGALKAVGPQEMKIVSFTGEVQIRIGDKLISVVPGGEMPEIPPGAEVTVLSGDAVFQAGETAINAPAGSGFTFSTAAGEKGGASVSVAASAGSRALTVTSGGNTAVIAGGSTVSVNTQANGAVTVAATAGSVTLTKADGTTSTILPGESVFIAKAMPEQAKNDEAKDKEKKEKEKDKTEEPKVVDETKVEEPVIYTTPVSDNPPPPQTILQDETVEQDEDIITVVSPSAP